MKEIQNNDEWEPIDKCEDNGKQEAGCVCAKNMFLLNGNCVVFDKCMEKGWSEWGDWGPCDDTCAVGTEGGKKERSRFHMETGTIKICKQFSWIFKSLVNFPLIQTLA